jgi:hypothetical protein
MVDPKAETTQEELASEDELGSGVPATIRRHSFLRSGTRSRWNSDRHVARVTSREQGSL